MDMSRVEEEDENSEDLEPGNQLNQSKKFDNYQLKDFTFVSYLNKDFASSSYLIKWKDEDKVVYNKRQFALKVMPKTYSADAQEFKQFI